MKPIEHGMIEQLQSIPLFGEMQPRLLLEMIGDEQARLSAFARGDSVVPPLERPPSLGVLMTGEAEVCKHNPDHTVILNRLTAPAVFGAAALFQEQQSLVSCIIALKPCSVLFFPQTLLTRMMRQDFTLVENYLRFLSQRIRFLNGRIDAFTQASAEGRLAWYLMDLAGSRSEFLLPASLSSLASMLNLGRASLYRALDSLCRAKIIERTGKCIRILNRKSLKKLCH